MVAAVNHFTAGFVEPLTSWLYCELIGWLVSVIAGLVLPLTDQAGQGVKRDCTMYHTQG